MLEKLIEKMPKKTLITLMEKGIREGEKALEEFLKKKLQEEGNRVAINIRLNKEDKLMVTLYDEGTTDISHQGETLAPYLLGQEVDK